MNSLVFIVTLVISFLDIVYGRARYLVTLDEENWKDVLKGEWMVEFYAPWCPACKDLAKAWDAFADWSKDLDINVANVDVTQNPGLSGRFLVTALPSIYHVKDGVFRIYSGPRDKEDFITFIEEKKWSSIDPLPSWKYPDSIQMEAVAVFFKLSMSVRDAHNYLVEKQGLPTWASYTIFAGATLFLGCILGFLIVCLIDCFFQSGSASPATTKKRHSKKDKVSDDEGDNKSEDRDGKASGDGLRHRVDKDVSNGQVSDER